MIKEYIKGKRKAFKKEVNIKHGFCQSQFTFKTPDFSISIH